MSAEKDRRAAADRIEVLLRETAALGDPHARAKAEELVSLLMRLYGEGLEHVLGIVHEEAGAAADRFFSRLSDDSLVSSLLVLHGLHPLDVETRVRRALDRVRPYLGSHGGDVTLLAVQDGIVRLRLEGSCHSCPSSTVTMKLAVERAIEEAAPEVTGIEVEGAVAAAADPSPAPPDAAAAAGLLQIGQNGKNGKNGQAAGAAAARRGAGAGARDDARPPASFAGASWIAVEAPPPPSLLEGRPQAPAEERCELCGIGIPDNHRHLVSLESRSLLCVCRACFLLFTAKGAAGGRYRAVPERCLFAPGLRLAEAQWERLQIPVNIAFFFYNSSLGRTVAFYPSPAGATESLLPLATWDEVLQANPLLQGLEPDVEALLVYKRDGGFECYVAPIDACYELVGRIRRRWKGFHGGEEAWQEIDAFFAALRERSTVARQGAPPDQGTQADGPCPN